MKPIVPSLPATVTPAIATEVPRGATLASLAKELAIGMRDPAEIIAAHNITPAAYEKLKNNEYFTKIVDSARVEWQSAGNTANRLQLEAAFTAEQILPAVYARAINGSEPLNHVVDVLKWLGDVGGLKKDPSRGQTGERFQITINLGADTQITYDGSKAPLAPDAALSALAGPVVDDKEDRV